MIRWQFFPHGRQLSLLETAVIQAFEAEIGQIDSTTHDLRSAKVLAQVEPYLTQVGFQVEQGEKTEGPVLVPAQLGRDGQVTRFFHADAWHEDQGLVLEVEAGRAVSHNQFIKDLLQASLMHDVSVLAIAVRNHNRDSDDYEKVARYLDILYSSERLRLPLEGVLLIGY